MKCDPRECKSLITPTGTAQRKWCTSPGWNTWCNTAITPETGNGEKSSELLTLCIIV